MPGALDRAPVGAGMVRPVTPARRTPRIDLTGPCLSLATEPAAGLDVLLVDLSGVEATDVASIVASATERHSGGIGVIGGAPAAVGAALDAGVGLVVLDVGAVDPAEVAAVASTGAVVVLHHSEPAVAVGAVDQLTAAGIDTSRVIVEVGPEHDMLEEVTVLERSAFGFRVGAVVPPPTGEALSTPYRRGWEIGTVTALVSLGVASLRGADPEVVRRVVATLRLVDSGAAGAPGTGPPVAAAAPTSAGGDR